MIGWVIVSSPSKEMVTHLDELKKEKDSLSPPK